MKRMLLLTACLCVAAAPLAHAAGINLTWSTGTVGCWPEKLGSLATWSCDNETDGPWSFVASFKMDAAKTDFTGISVIIGGQAADPYLPNWWQVFNTGACRQNDLTLSADFTSALNLKCKDPFAGAATITSVQFQTAAFPPPPPLNVPLPSRFRLKVLIQLPTPKSLAAATEWYALRGTVDAGHTTVAQPLCSGCASTVYLGLVEIGVVGSSSSYKITQPLNSPCIGWQSWGDDFLCRNAATPVRNPTWGLVRTLYR